MTALLALAALASHAANGPSHAAPFLATKTVGLTTIATPGWKTSPAVINAIYEEVKSGQITDPTMLAFDAYYGANSSMRAAIDDSMRAMARQELDHGMRDGAIMTRAIMAALDGSTARAIARDELDHGMTEGAKAKLAIMAALNNSTLHSAIARQQLEDGMRESGIMHRAIMAGTQAAREQGAAASRQQLEDGMREGGMMHRAIMAGTQASREQDAAAAR